tara:strand:+ start:1336 stop:2205 length:870 start_codon:yes stop_codon:yes gene_type:complete
MSQNPYLSFASSFRQLVEKGVDLPLGGIKKPPRPKLAKDAPVVLIFSPHPDDECIIGSLPLRLMREAGTRVVNVAVTLGSNKKRKQARLSELRDACDYLGFELQETLPNGLERITPATRENEVEHWTSAIESIKVIFTEWSPEAIFFPHASDWNGTHVGVHHLIMDALAAMPSHKIPLLFETEYWGQMHSPNLMVESSETDLADLLAALSHHIGEVRRNPFHLRMPAWMQDNVRLGTEVVGGQGGDAPPFDFATLYRVGRLLDGVFEPAWSNGKMLAKEDAPSSLFDFL